ncbi:MAG: HAD-IC family P-type ATPase [Candidatus Sungbacteria bacterium]|uniref:HAD-IC family P-type ATPase n=1 Tax=Candidatus Sungiibacteriota bacterium TaxID=2750080 RepID=A0A932YW06_9BACT|nr:HAD-IC family P-type ATPase [Candidatus Sungbacteria bacterium]
MNSTASSPSSRAETAWHQKSVPETLLILGSSGGGLSPVEAERRLSEYGQNRLTEPRPESLAVIFLRQFRSPLIYILLAASATVFLMGEVIDGSIILAVLLFNAVVGTIQEGKAQHTLRALKRFVETNATVMRGGKELLIRDYDVVPGDILILQDGDKVPADARVTASRNLKSDEAAITGESEPVHKTSEALTRPASSPAEQRNMVFKGTHIVAGNGTAVAVATGQGTIIGRISEAIAVLKTEIPLQANIRHLSGLIIIVVVSISVSLFFLGMLFDKSVREMFTTAVALSVSVIPEGLPIVMTLVLATGVWRMSRRNALVKRLAAVEALGQARVIAVDKTGTITRNELVIQKVYADRKLFDVAGVGYEPAGDIRLGERAIVPANHPEVLLAARIAAYCANARVVFSEESQQWRVAGDPTEAAMVVFARKAGFQKDELERESPLLAELPFDYRTKYHATVHRTDGHALLTVAGAPEVVLRLSHRIWHAGRSQPLAAEERERLESVLVQLSREGLRVVAVAMSRKVPERLTPEVVHGLTFVGFFAMRDALRPEVAEALSRTAAAGIRVVMITGDHKITALAIGKEAGIYRPGDDVLSGDDIDAESDAVLSEKVKRVSVFARVTPEHKIRIIQAFRRRGEVVAMTGDGVNDAPSLVAADLGVAMGRIGTEVAKEAADIVLLDDNFGSIVAAVEEGRSIYLTIQKVILYLFSTSVGEVLTISGALFLGFPLPVLAAQIIWLNFVTDGFLDVALAMEPKERGLLDGRFERPRKFLIDRLMLERMTAMAIPMMIGTLIVFSRIFPDDLVKGWTMALTTLAIFQWFNAWNCRSAEQSVFRMNPFSNIFLVAATVTVVVLQVSAVSVPVLQKILHTVPLSGWEWLLALVVGSAILWVEELRKLIRRSLRSRSRPA